MHDPVRATAATLLDDSGSAANAGLAGLSPSARRRIRRAERWLDKGEPANAEQALAEALRMEPGHPELLRMRALVLHRLGRYADAVKLLRSALDARPDDPQLHNNIGSALGQSGDFVAAREAFQRSTELAPEDPLIWFNLGKACDSLQLTEQAQEAFARAITEKPDYVEAIIMHAATERVLGRIDQAAAGYRHALALQPESVEAWTELIGLKTEQHSTADLAAIETISRRSDLSDEDRISIRFALGLAWEASNRHADAFRAFSSANAARRKTVHWDAAGFSRYIDTIQDAFGTGIAGTPDPDFGREVIFLIGMPRSGSTLTEQILASHSRVEGMGEVDDLASILDKESQDRAVPFPNWVHDADGTDWQRLGESYLQRVSRKRPGDAPMFTDKFLSNWQLVGAARAMLPGARFVDCRRDPLETCWSCYKHQFGKNQPYSSRFTELAGWWQDYDRLVAYWLERYPGLVYQHQHEQLIADPERRIGELLAHCGLDFEPACLRFHETSREVRTASAAQVRQPLRRNTARVAGYGSLLDPLREALDREPRS